MRRKVLLGGLLAALSALALAGGLHEAEASFPGGNGRIVYVSDRESGDPDLAGLYTIGPDGADRVQVAAGGANPTWSASGTRIAFDRDGDLFVIGADGAGETNITSSPESFEQQPAWSPDGSKLVFVRNGELFTVGVDGSGEEQLTDHPDFSNISDSGPMWSPDGATIVFASDRDDGSLFRGEIYVINADGTGAMRLTFSTGVGDTSPQWSPDGARIVWVREQDEFANQTDLWIMNADGTAQTQLTTDDDFDQGPAWSPDGTRIVFQAGDLLVTINPDGTGLTPLTSGDVPVETSDRDPDWGSLSAVMMRELTVIKSGDGSGSVTSVPAGVSCGADCSALYSSGTAVTLTATAAAGSRLGAWSGCDDAKEAECAVTMTSDRSVTVSFVQSADPPPTPVVAALSPTSGPAAGATSVTIAGANLTGATAVAFGSTPATSFAVDSDTQITAVTPAHAAGSVDVRVTGPGGTSANTAADDFTFLASSPPCTIVGTSGPDTLAGTAGDDSICGLGGNDLILGGRGNDTLIGGGGDDVMDGGSDADELLGGSGTDTASYATQGSDVQADLDGFADDGPAGPRDRIATDVENIVGGAGNDTLTGSPGANVLAGGRGSDTLDGGEGADVLTGGEGTDTVSYGNRESGVSVNTVSAGGDGAPGEGDDVAPDMERILGGSGNDLLTTGGGNQTLLGNRGNDLLFAGAGTDRLHGGDGNDALFAGADNDELMGENGDDVLEGGGGRDDLRGGAGFDTVTYALRVGGVSVSLDGVNNDGAAGELDDVEADVEKLVGGQGDDLLLGDHHDQELLGLGGDDELRGLDGDDLLDGGAGADRLHGDREPDEQGGAVGDDRMLGGPGDDLLRGDNGDDVLDGGPGADLLDGGGELNSVSYAGRTRHVRVSQDEVANDGEPGEKDDVRRIASLVGTAFGDVLEGAGAGGTLSGGAGNDELIGSDRPSVRETLIGGPGNDTLRGRGGQNTLYGEEGNDDLEGGADTDDLAGGEGNDTLRGGNSTDQLFGGGGNDDLAGGAGDDLLDGGLGRDRLDTGSASTTANGTLNGDTVTYAGRPENLGLSIDGIANDGAPGEQDFIVRAETLIGGNGSDTISGTSASNRLHGGPGDDTLSGRQGNDILFGGPGNDVMRGGSGEDRFLGNEGVDTVSFAGRNDRVFADADSILDENGEFGVVVGTKDDGEGGEGDTINHDVEDLVGGDRGDTLTGNGRTNRLFGGPGNDTLRGDAADSLDGGPGTDTCTGGAVRTSCESG